MEINLNSNITFMPRAHALLNGQTWIDLPILRFGSLCAIGDLVNLPGIAATFFVAGRIWSFSDAGEMLEVVLDIAPVESLLSVVK